MMVRWTLKNLLREPASVLASVGGIALSLLLVIVIEGMFAGESERIVAYVRKAGADVWVMQAGVSNMHMASSLIRRDLERTVEEVPGVLTTTPILYTNGVVAAGGRQWFSYVVGLQPTAARGGPWAMAEGRDRPGPGEAVIPDVMARKAGVRLGRKVAVLGRELTVVGISAGTYSMANSVTFVSYTDLAGWLSAPAAASYLLVASTPGEAPAVLAERIRHAIPDVNALPRDVLAEADRSMAMQMGVDLVGVMSWVGALVAALIVAFATYAATIRRSRELGIAKALGLRNRALYGGVLVQALVIATLGCAMAFVLAQALRPALEVLVPEVALLYPRSAWVRLATATAAITVVASLAPARQIARVDPAIVFRD
jgi:putative ABC transport system permease protein